ncbi:hypothetical protein RFX64_00230 [Streptococcus mutans]|jgi:hypothetical protein|uniref:hypothetical protein n=1 Tax=Streptococcus mutans TaxID=1309 RepID=UPI00298A5352|nr:hypothetical protein [Streptococcus mutans]MDW5556082.1 hypothetical protein [Streptococcus mutans]
MKKILTLLMVFGLAMALVACSGDNLDGKYYRFFKGSNDGAWTIENKYSVKISGDTFTHWGEFKEQGTINKKEKIITGRGMTISYSYDKETEVLTINGETYAKKGSRKYRALKTYDKLND